MSDRWRYQVHTIKPTLMRGHSPEDLQSLLDRQAASGWELVQVVVPGPMANMVAIFRRPA